MVNMAKFSKKLEGRPNQIYNRFNKENLEDGDAYRNQGRYITQRPSQIYNQYDQETLEDGELRNQGRYDYQFSNFIPLANINNSSSKGNQLGIYQKKSQIQKNSLPLKKIEERGKEVWRRKGFPESSKQGGNSRVTTQEKEGKDEGITINVQAVGNGWLNRSAVGKIKRLISAQELESLFKKGLARNVQIKPMGGRLVIITFLSEEQRNETLKEKWLELWFDEVKPWNGESSKSERFAWIACYWMPLNAWNVQTFRAIGSLWGCFIELDSDTLREVSFAKGRILIATENPNKIGGKLQLLVDRRKYTVRMEEEESFRMVISTNQVPNCVANSEPEEDDDEVDNADGDMDASKKKKDNSVDDMEKQRNKNSDDHRAKNNEEVAGKYENNGLNGSHQVENCNEESSNSAHGLDSIVQDSQSPMNVEYVESANNRCHVQSVEVGVDDKHEQEKDCRTEDNNPVQCDSNIIVRASQVHGINLHVDLNPSVVRRNVRSQQLEVSLNSEGDEIDEYIIASQEQEHIEIDKEMQNTIKAGNTLGIKFGDYGIKRMTKMIENEAKILKASLKNNSFAPLMRDE